MITGGPNMWSISNDTPIINFCPWCGQKLPDTLLSKYEVTVRYNRGLGAEFKKFTIECKTLPEAKKIAEEEAFLLLPKESQILESQARLIE